MDFSANPEIEQLLSTEARDNTPNTCVRQPDERLSMNELYLQGDVSSSRLSLQGKSTTLKNNTDIGESSSDTTTVTTPSSIIVNNSSNDDPPPYVEIPPPYSAITPPNHIGWPYGLFSFGNSYSMDETTHRMEIPLTPFQACLTPATGFHSEGNNGQYPYSMPLTPYRFFKFDCGRNSFVPRDTTDNEIAEKNDDKKSRKFSTILVAAAVIIFLMVLSLMVRFIMEKSWWRR
ncbi:uncharacterized protein LOC105840746 isoform X2 [Monomorium pharaonis]|uniref:uncharacterized protein LOC105840746 isoform X2 n=1 Tax=Monomorium pharaonis TaxID=307658 RepID=UPI001746F6CD|nr:uncharacterized protein LOC105840746 isoform X2 [Monomorium pharaonis]